MSTYDLAIMGGIVVDGTGLARRRGDIGVKDGRIVKIGFVAPAEADQVIDADGLHVAPGIVDAHTHYDPQLTFEPHATSSCYHGVTTVLAGNCGFSVAPNRPDQRDYLARMFAKVEGMSPVALSAVQWEFESFPEFLASRPGKLGVNMACYVGHSAVRRTVMGEAGSEREAERRRGRADAPHRGRGHGGGGGGLLVLARARPSSTATTAPSPAASPRWTSSRCCAPRRAATTAGRSATSTAAPSAGLDQADKDLLLRLGTVSRLPIILQGLGGRSKVDVPGAEWEQVSAVDRGGGAPGRGHLLAAAQPSLRPRLPHRDGHQPLRGGALVAQGGGPRCAHATIAWPCCATPPHATRCATPWSTPTPTAPRARPCRRRAGVWSRSTRWPPPHNEKFVRRTIADIAAELGKEPADALLDLALDEDLQTVFRYVNKSRAWEEAVADGQSHPAMIIGVSDGGAHLDRDDGSDWSTAFLAFWVRDRKLWSLEEGIRQLTQVPAALLGFEGRGMLLPGPLGRRLRLRPRHRRARVQEAGEGLPRRRGPLLGPPPGHLPGPS